MQFARPAFPTTLLREFLPLSERNGVCPPGSIPGRQIPGIQKLGIRKHSARSRCFACFGEHHSPGFTDILHENSLQRRPFTATFRFFAYQAPLLYHTFSCKSRSLHSSFRRFFQYFYVMFPSFCTKIEAFPGFQEQKELICAGRLEFLPGFFAFFASNRAF